MAISLRLRAPLADEEILDLSARNPGLHIEQAASGELILTPTGAEAGRREAVLGAQLYNWARSHGAGVTFGPSAGFRLPDRSLGCPDAAWASRDRREALAPAQREGFAPLCPDVVFKIRSPSDLLADLRDKMRTYLAKGARLAVLIDGRCLAVELYGPGRDPEIREQVETFSLDPVLPGFALDLRPIFG